MCVGVGNRGCIDFSLLPQRRCTPHPPAHPASPPAFIRFPPAPAPFLATICHRVWSPSVLNSLEMDRLLKARCSIGLSTLSYAAAARTVRGSCVTLAPESGRFHTSGRPQAGLNRLGLLLLPGTRNEWPSPSASCLIGESNRF